MSNDPTGISLAEPTPLSLLNYFSFNFNSLYYAPLSLILSRHCGVLDFIENINHFSIQFLFDLYSNKQQTSYGTCKLAILVALFSQVKP